MTKSNNLYRTGNRNGTITSFSATVSRIRELFDVVVTTAICFSALFFFKVFCNGKIIGENSIRKNLGNGFVLASNHVSYMDWLVLFAYFILYHDIRLVFIAKDKLFHHPVWKYVVRGAKTVRVSDCGTKFLSHKDYKRLTDAKYVGIFPEATRSEKGNLISAHGGAIKIAAKKGLPLIPVRLEGFYDVLPKGKKIPVPHPCRIIIGQECYYSHEEIRNATEHCLSVCMFKILQNLEYVSLNEQDPSVDAGKEVAFQK